MKVGVITGTGTYDLGGLEAEGIEVVHVSRHEPGHKRLSNQVDHRGNIERLRGLAAGRQVLCITHLPQIASLADAHFRIEKDTGGDVTRTTVEPLEGQEVVAELCRMLGADTSDAGARRHAEELLAMAA